MQRASRFVRRAEIGAQTPAETVTLDRAARYRRRIAMTTDGGEPFLLDLPEATHLGHGDALELDDGRLVAVRAATEPLASIRACDAVSLARIAWHIGNRHLPAEITPTTIYIQRDHVIEEMVRGLGGDVQHVMRSFDPEGGAYGGKGALDRGSHHHHGGHGQEQGHDSHHGHAPAVPRPRVWRPD